MKFLIASALMLLAPALALAQTDAKPAAKSETKAAAKPAAKPAAKSEAKSAKSSEKAAPKKAVAKSEPTSSRTQLKSATNQVAAGIIAAEAALSPAELAIADRVHTGRIPCELGAFVTVTAEPASPGHFHVEGKGFKYFMSPVATTTGTVRLEDQKGGAVWLQIGNKSMLMNQKVGQRLADECMSPEQQLVAEAIKKNPPVSVLEPMTVK
ncbi:hypothetical protein ASF11_11680 [Acidovorax sp. Leaf76]|uniref:hypothetical protein n=1 Tax=unclassified Acidovorax TaxID=2684926 RepID=UPI0006FBD47C|nr:MULTISPECIES: hypothetical protein [unclassified Acidovorax]KQO15224.1 hypothetical protein ASF11_11680 [Acidovorax sp. Leaf76]KQO19211.1 hypothetical protein ASF16_11515 [Acidovorax sp. Leaf78]KQO32032.1 hypothetical protein ASF19_10855 [Acidovorax sp. Leaf84]KQS29096.1 hypothetical protein ASG27_12740 [Acidovorax sp. Leaf191]